MELDKVLLVQQLRLYAQSHGKESFESKYSELLIDMVIKEIENISKNKKESQNGK